MLINNIEYEIIDTIEKITIVDSFIMKNKIGGGRGEAKLYIGQITDNKILRFFDMLDTRGKTFRCFMLKNDLLKYLVDIKEEYINPTQDYKNKNNLSELWKKYHLEISAMENMLAFELEDQNQIEPPRIYFNVQGRNENCNLIRKIALPNLSYLSYLKLKNKSTKEVVFYFRIFADLSYLSIETQENKINARIGQGKYREGILNECPFCPITMVSDDRLLITSHIKPWRMSDDFEKIDPKNGLMLTPTIDFLFARGFISFSATKQILLSPWISKINYKNLGLVDLKVYPMLPLDGREHYLEFHRNNILKQ